ncbi:amplified in osteosarcoma [Exophiala viscosa]|uniref:amplified in osteosarcoma n=1 Tax=Exophiala viscosa TaxID=2486360 RepID=UPI0021A0DBF5|nr:amplified in osteosarcoma [Exophiala viscosa]
MKVLPLAAVVVFVGRCLASESAFSVNDDLFAFPQYAVEFADSYVLEADASLLSNGDGGNLFSDTAPATSDVSDLSSKINTEGHETAPEAESYPPGTYERLLLHGYPHLCFIPEAKAGVNNGTREEPSAADREKELDHAVTRGSELLQGMASNQCLYYSTGWWTYSFCYNSQVTQFHALPPGANGRVWPPQEDPTTPSYVLGKFEMPKKPESAGPNDLAPSTEVKSQAETNYLVQRLEGGTPCDLTGNNRKIEVQFHCNPQLTDRIGWIKETATCAYLMMIYTPRLCNDVAFQPPKESRAHPITCKEIITEDEVASWDAAIDERNTRQTLGQGKSAQIVLGHIEVGAMKYVGREGKRLERGRIVLTQDEKAETVIMQKDGQVSSLSAAELKKLDLSPEDVESFRKELQKLAGAKDWKIERLDDVNGHIQLRGIVSAEDEDEEEPTQTPNTDKDKDEDETSGSQEEYVEEV